MGVHLLPKINIFLYCSKYKYCKCLRKNRLFCKNYQTNSETALELGNSFE